MGLHGLRRSSRTRLRLSVRLTMRSHMQANLGADIVAMIQAIRAEQAAWLAKRGFTFEQARKLNAKRQAELQAAWRSHLKQESRQ
jgi:hypothetical protein